MPDRVFKPLKLLAQDAGDLQVVSAALQDAVGKIGDIRFEQKARRLTLSFNRYCWECGGGRRVRAAVQFGSVERVEARRLRSDAPDAVVELLSIGFEPAEEPPGGTAVLTFAGGGEMRVMVECLDVLMADVSEPWPTRRRPRHED
ncbi:DUF2948 family protein [Phenylobacterium sp.]|uniref:DUF2948 family protein n=1 Tax=Phenylobacterium sp. TaxID=1871053 RepID=UPI00199A9611|nr:DUF2948 family protein [Phenylobacterium sp.]MBC7168677.1 DUF2948 family protein [Phenylobacterium sp.]